MTTKTKFVSKQLPRAFPLITLSALPSHLLYLYALSGLLGRHKNEHAKSLLPTE